MLICADCGKQQELGEDFYQGFEPNGDPIWLCIDCLQQIAIDLENQVDDD